MFHRSPLLVPTPTRFIDAKYKQTAGRSSPDRRTLDAWRRSTEPREGSRPKWSAGGARRNGGRLPSLADDRLGRALGSADFLLVMLLRDVFVRHVILPVAGLPRGLGGGNYPTPLKPKTGRHFQKGDTGEDELVAGAVARRPGAEGAEQVADGASARGEQGGDGQADEACEEGAR